jgi:sulfoxide reductase catalytic subunit YedY
MTLIKQANNIKPSEITPRSVYMDRRKFMQQSITASLLLSIDAMLPAWAKKWPDLKQSSYSTTDAVNSFEDITTYNNFYEFGTDKSDPHKNATAFNPHPWSITVEG